MLITQGSLVFVRQMISKFMKVVVGEELNPLFLCFIYLGAKVIVVKNKGKTLVEPLDKFSLLSLS